MEAEKKKSIENSNLKRSLRYEQTSLFKCRICKHEFPPAYMLFVADIICKDRESCMKRYLKKYENYVKACGGDRNEEEDMKWWKEQKFRLKQQGFGDEQCYYDIKYILKRKITKWIQAADAEKAEKKAKKAKRLAKKEKKHRDESPERTPEDVK